VARGDADEGDPVAVLEIVIVPVLPPWAVGAKVTLIVQLALDANVDGLVGQFVAIAKSPAAAGRVFGLNLRRWVLARDSGVRFDR
jgi:hypothetical protein